jgi:Tetratricopeptide repeat
VKAWLRTHGDWLLVLDNADNLALCKEFIPPAYGGQVLLTTRAQATGRLAQRIEVDTMPEEVGVRFLLRRAGLIESDTSLEQVSPQQRELARELVHELGGLPLALDQAGAYMEETPCGIQEYLRLYRTRRAALLSRRGGLVDDHPASVATTWSLAFASVEQVNPAAADLLRLCAFLHADAIPEDLLRQGATQTESPLQTIATDDLAFHEALRTLGAYSLLRRDLASRTLSIHRLVQAVLIDAMTPKITRAWVQHATRVVLAALPESFSTGWVAWERLLPHVLTCASHILQAQLVSPEATHFLQAAGDYLRERGLYTEAESLYQGALQIHEQELGPMHPEIAGILTNLGNVYQARGKLREAKEVLQRALVICEQQVGLDLEQAHVQLIREHCEGLLEHLAGSAEVSGHIPGEWHHSK